MSTYTDLHNRIKENLTILRKPGSKDDGMSPQKVILINPENQFYGTFNGKMNVTGGILSGLKIVDSELEGVKLDGATIGGISLSELKDTIDVNTQDIEQLQKDAKYISASHDELSTGLSSAIDDLSVKLNEKLDNTIEDVKKSIGGVVGDVAILSDGFNDLSTKVEALSSGTLNGVVYRGQLVLHRDSYTLPRQLFNDDPACCLLEGTQASLKNGWMWRIALDRQNVSGDYVHVSDPNTGKELDLGESDYIIIKNHLTSLYEVVPDNKMRLDDFDVINAQDEDDTKLAVLKQVSAYLDTKIDESLVSAKAYTDEVSTSLSTLFDGKLSSVSAYVLDESIKYTNDVSSELSDLVDARLVSLSNDLSSYSNKLCSDLSTQVDAEYVHRAGDTIAKLSVTGDLDVAGKTTINHDFGEAGGTKLELSKDKVELKSFAPLSISSTNDSTIVGHNIALNAHNLSINLEDGVDDLFIGDRTIKEVLSDTYLISDDISYRYDKSENALKLGVRGHELSVDVAELFDKKIIKDVRVVKRDNRTYIAITFDVDGDPSTSEDEKTIEIRIDDFFKLYTSGYGISIDNELNISIAKSFDDQVQAIQGYVNELSGPVGPYIGIIPSLSNEISSLRQDEKFEVQFKNLPIDAEAFNARYGSIGEFLSAQLQPYDYNWIRNNTEYLIQFLSGDGGVPLSARISINDSLRTSIGNGDMILVHAVDDTASGPSKVNFSDIIAYDRSKKTGNTFIIKAGVSRYEFEAEAKKRADDDNFISSWLSTNFGNTMDVDVSPTTIFKQELSAQRDLSVASNAYILSDLSVAGSLYVNGAQLGITVQPVDPTIPSGETETVARTVADKIEFKTSLEDNSPTIKIQRSSITLNSAPVYVNAESSFVLNADGNKVIDATSSQVEILSVLNVNSDQATITTLSSGILSADHLIAREVEILEDLSVENAFVKNKLKVDTEFDALSGAFWCHKTDDEILVNTNADYISLIASNEDTSIANKGSKIELDLEHIDISSDTIYLLANDEIQTDFAKVKDFNSMSSIADLCSALSISISSLSDFVISNDNNLSTAIDSKIFIDGISAESLSAQHISRDDYYNLVSTDSTISNVLYIVSSENINAYGQRIENLAEPELSADAATKGYVDGISSSLNSQIQKLSDDLSNEISSLEDIVISNDACLSASIDKKIFIDGISAETLCAIHISQDDFYQRVRDGQILSNELYIVSGSYINAYDQQLKNLATPTDLSDATTKEYVDNADFSISGQLSGLISAMYDDLEHVTTDGIISSLHQKSCISTVICAVVGIRDTLVDLRQTLSTMLGL